MNTIAGDSSAAVVSDDDLLTEILLRLPLFSLRLFKLVSKRFLTLITNPNFTLRRNQSPMIDPPSGLFLKRQSLKFQYDLVPLDARVPANRSPLPTTFNFRELMILQSCNGLLLGCIMPDKFFVHNPTINRFKSIPHCQFGNSFSSLVSARMAFDPSKSPRYKVIQPVYSHRHGDQIQIYIYSSETCNWSVCDDRFPRDCFSDFSDGICWNGSIHWLDDMEKDLLFRLDVEERPLLTTIQKPAGLLDDYELNQKLFQSCGSLLLCTGPLCPREFMIFEMRERYSGWSVKYHVKLDHIFPKTCRQTYLLLCKRLRCIVIGKHEEDSFLVVEICGKIVQYNIVSKSVSKLYKLESVYNSASFEFIASSAAV